MHYVTIIPSRIKSLIKRYLKPQMKRIGLNGSGYGLHSYVFNGDCKLKKKLDLLFVICKKVRMSYKDYVTDRKLCWILSVIIVNTR